jgi:glucans biosynthesis protein
MNRRTFMAALAASALTPLQPATAQVAAPSLLEAARALSQQPYVAPPSTLPPPFAGLDYDAFRGIRPRTGLAANLPQGDGFELDLLPPGLFFPEPVRIERQVDGAINDVPFSPDLFSFEPRYFESVPDTAPGAGFSGFRLRHPLILPDRMDEVAVFQGASYFRAIGQNMIYGLSTRAVAIGTGGNGPEEFPGIRHWQVFEGSGDTIRVDGLIDSPSLAGHISVTLKPGQDTQTGITVTLFPRIDIETIGIAPLTSMYLKGPMLAAVSDDFRPRVHDSDVLMIENGAGETLWRPIANPASVETSAFADSDPAAFGLYQSERTYEAFEDSEAHYQDRPSAIVRPEGDWGDGAVMLVEIPTSDEFMDNIVAFWRPAQALRAGGSYAFSYDLTWTARAPTQTGPAKIRQSRSGQEHDRPNTRRFVIDFEGKPDGLTADLSTSLGEDLVFGQSLFELPDGRGTRFTFLLTPPADAQALELRLVLRNGAGIPASPVWLHRWTRSRQNGV